MKTNNQFFANEVAKLVHDFLSTSFKHNDETVERLQQRGEALANILFNASKTSGGLSELAANRTETGTSPLLLVSKMQTLFNQLTVYCILAANRENPSEKTSALLKAYGLTGKEPKPGEVEMIFAFLSDENKEFGFQEMVYRANAFEQDLFTIFLKNSLLNDISQEAEVFFVDDFLVFLRGIRKALIDSINEVKELEGITIELIMEELQALKKRVGLVNA